jgi:hypothetical protein
MMNYFRLAISLAMLAGLAGGVVLRATQNDPGANEDWSTRKIMIKLYVGKPSLFSAVYKDIQKPEPDWKTDEKNLAEIVRLTYMLTRQKPLRGSQEAWDKLVQDFVEKASVTRQNVKEHKLEPARASLRQVQAMCDTCHDNHGIQ